MKKSKKHFIVVLIIIFACMVSYNLGKANSSKEDSSVYTQEVKKTDTEKISSVSNGYTKSYSSYGEDALTDEEAEALRGTGYHNTRPNSMAEDMEIKARQVKCKICGKHSDNGINSMCDRCWESKK